MLRRNAAKIQQGFSLAEVIIVIAIFGILAAFGVSSYTEMIQNTRIRTATESIQNGIQLARAEAVKRNSMIKFQLGDASAWVVCPVVLLDDDCPEDPNNPINLHGRSASEGSTTDTVVTTIPAGNTAVVFNGLGLTAQDSNPFTAVEVDIDSAILSATASRELRVLVGTGGSTRMCDPSPKLAEDDPRAC